MDGDGQSSSIYTSGAAIDPSTGIAIPGLTNSDIVSGTNAVVSALTPSLPWWVWAGIGLVGFFIIKGIVR